MTSSASPRHLLLFEERDTETVLSNCGQQGLLFTFAEGLGGAWTELHEGRELIRFGYPRNSKNDWFRVFDDPGKNHNAGTLALERIIFARQIELLGIAEERLQKIGRRSAAVHPSVKIVSRGKDEDLTAFLKNFREHQQP